MQQRWAARHPLCYAVAAALALPVGALGWFELVYLWFGFTGEDASPQVNLAACLLAFGVAFGWPLRRAQRPLQVLRRGCTLGMVLAVLLPLAGIAVLLLWQNAKDRVDLGMGGLMLYSFPLVAFGAAVVLVIVFGLGRRWASRRLRAEPAARPQDPERP